MATKISYSEKDRKAYTTFEWNGKGKGNASIRGIKMVRPICKECQVGLDTPADWFVKCPHEPYFSLSPKVVKTPIYGEDEDGDMILQDTQVRTKMIRVPNATEVVKSIRQNDDMGIEKARAKGFKMFPEIKLAPMCEMYGCGTAWPTIRTEYGDYCSEVHAKLCVADITEVKFTVNDPRVYKQELQSVVI